MKDSQHSKKKNVVSSSENSTICKNKFEIFMSDGNNTHVTAIRFNDYNPNSSGVVSLNISNKTRRTLRHFLVNKRYSIIGIKLLKNIHENDVKNSV